MKKWSLLVMVFLLFAVSALAESEAGDGRAAPTLAQARYQFEHVILPTDFYEQPEAVLSAIKRVGVYDLFASLCEENGVASDYAAGDYAEHWYTAEDDTVLLQVEMPKPDTTTLCERVYFVYNAETGSAAYFTVEYDNLFGEMDFLCGWTAEHEHVNYGSIAVLGRADENYAQALASEAEQVAQMAGAPPALIPSGIAIPSPVQETAPDETPETVSSIRAALQGLVKTLLGGTPSPEATPEANLVLIASPDVNFTTMADAAYAWDCKKYDGVTYPELDIYIEREGSVPYVNIWQQAYLTADPFAYITEDWTPFMQDLHGDDFVGFEEYEAYEIGGGAFPAALYTYWERGEQIDDLRLYDNVGGETFVFTAKYAQEDSAATLAALDTAIRYFEFDSAPQAADTPKPVSTPVPEKTPKANLVPVSCAAQGFVTMVDTSYDWEVEDGNGITIYTEEAGYVPYVAVLRRAQKLSNPVNYLNNVYREYMEERYGDVGMTPCREVKIGGKTLYRADYHYSANGNALCLTHLVEVREDGDVEYDAKYAEGKEDTVMDALETAVRHYRVESVEVQKEILSPMGLEAPDTQNGTYWVKISDADKILDGGRFTASLYAQDRYAASGVEGLRVGDRVRVNGQVFTVSALIPHDGGEIELYIKEDFDGYIVFRKQEDGCYLAVVNDWVPVTFVADENVMMPLPDDFTYVHISGEEDVLVYDAYTFVQLMTGQDAPDLNPYNTMVEFRDGLLMMILHTDYPQGPQED